MIIREIKLDRNKVEKEFPSFIGKFINYEAVEYKEFPNRFTIWGWNPNINADILTKDCTIEYVTELI